MLKVWMWLLTSCLLLLSCNVRHKRDLPDLTGFAPPESYSFAIQMDTVRGIGNDFLVKNKYANWELYVSGSPFEIGSKIGALTEDLYRQQDQIFFDKLEDFVPSKFKQRWLMHFMRWYNRKLPRYIPEEYKKEIYALSRYSDSKYDFVADQYRRALYLHGAHDIGHSMQDLAVVGCSSLAVWDDKSADGGLLLGRNFDFYVGEEFAKNKLISFIRPERGIPFASVSWPGMMGVLSGMNLEGLTVTMNAGKSTIPLVARAPISIVAREILQYATNLQEAIAIAKDKRVFVSESLMIGSAADNKAIVIEISPKKFGVYEVNNADYLICTNHFQSEEYAGDKRNQVHIEESHSQYRYDKINDFVSHSGKLTPERIVGLLRDTKGKEGQDIGLGNEKALNQLWAHHAIVFQPQKRMFWVSTRPYQLGAFTAYDLTDIFGQDSLTYTSHLLPSATIAEDTTWNREMLVNFELFKVENRKMEARMDSGEEVSEIEWEAYQQLNPQLWNVYYQKGQYDYSRKDYIRAKKALQTALSKEITTLPARRKVEQLLEKAEREIRRTGAY
jgi:predicted choloylglycine hydrolase